VSFDYPRTAQIAYGRIHVRNADCGSAVIDRLRTRRGGLRRIAGGVCRAIVRVGRDGRAGIAVREVVA
jgi:hypothetical protein